jgi:hypothetical protein
MKHIIFTLFIFCNLYSQNKSIKVIDKITLEPINGIKIYYKNNLIGTTDTKGNFLIKKDIDKISLVKENYLDTILTPKEIIKLTKIEGLQLKEVIITTLTEQRILDSIYNKLFKYKYYKMVYWNLKNTLKFNNDTICFIDNIIEIRKEGYFINISNKIINKLEKSENIYKINHESIMFNKDYLHSNQPFTNLEIQYILRYRKYYSYDILKTNDLYKNFFKPKNKRVDYPYTGYIIVDKYDFGIYEFQHNCMPNTRNLTFEGKIINFKIDQESSSLINKKNENGIYELVQYTFFSKFKVMDGVFKGSVFENQCYKEPTKLSNDKKEFKKFNILNYTIYE